MGHDDRGRHRFSVWVEDPDDDRGDRGAGELDPMKAATEEGAIPANVSENTRPIVTAGLAKLVEEVKR